jgi:alpha-1,6-mannosyltransferase
LQVSSCCQSNLIALPPKIKWLAAGIVSCIFYYLLAYELQRTDTWWLQASFLVLFLTFVLLLKADKNWVLGFGILFRLIFLFSMPALSDDFYRFIWDGVLWHNGIHPFSHPPAYYMTEGHSVPGLTQELFNGLNSKEYFTVYPPLHQLVFWLSTMMFDGSLLSAIIPMRLVLVGCEILFLLLIANDLAKKGKSPALLAIYALNPLVIVEVAGNLHFEGMVAFFLLGSVFLLPARKLLFGSVSLAAAIATKLTPIIAGPALMLAGGKSNWWKIVTFTVIASLLLFLPIIDFSWLSGQGESLDLYFRKFEFNGSFYYLLREIGFWWKGYNVIATLGPRLALAGGVLILIVSWANWPKNKDIFQTLSLVFFIYYLAATTVHPWYVVPLVALSVFSGYRFPVVWSYCILWTYIGYTLNGYNVPWLAITFEYLLVIAFFAWEVFFLRGTKSE